jgi:hypothetical protein
MDGRGRRVRNIGRKGRKNLQGNDVAVVRGRLDDLVSKKEGRMKGRISRKEGRRDVKKGWEG